MRKGAIIIGDVDVRTVAPSELYRNVLYVPRSTFLLEGAVLENIDFFEAETLAAESALRAALPKDLLGARVGEDRGKNMFGG